MHRAQRATVAPNLLSWHSPDDNLLSAEGAPSTGGFTRLRPFDFSGRRLPPGRADRFQASVRNGRSCAGLPYRLWQLRHGLRAFPGGPV